MYFKISTSEIGFLCVLMGPLQDKVTWYKVRHTAMQKNV